MPTPTEIAQRIWNIFTLSTPALLEAYQERIKQPGNLPAGAEPIPNFSPFDKNHMARAAAIRKELKDALRAGPTEEEGLSRALDHFESLLDWENPDLLFYTLQVFLVHYKGTVPVALPSLLAREPERIVPRGASGEAGMALPVAEGSEDETNLDWFRESPFLNEHHQHWHVVYDTEMQLDRQGEMFFFMHQQMLARYNAERLADDVPEVKAFDDFTHPIQVGYVPGPDERLGRPSNRRRAPEASLSSQQADAQTRARQMIERDIDQGEFDPGDDTLAAETKAVNSLGSTIESNVHEDARLDKRYVGYHGFGHMQIAGLNNGVMGSTVTAIRDVVFWEWHKGIDNFYFRLQQRLEPYDFSADAPPVELRKSVDAMGRPYSPDLIICTLRELTGIDGEDFGESAFGGANWDKDFATGSHTVTINGRQMQIKTSDTLNTSMRDGRIVYRTPAGQQRSYSYPYLLHEPFCYFIRVQNLSMEIKRVTVRLFLCPLGREEDRRQWIEMDKFLYELMPQAKTVIFRPDTASSVFRKPADPNVDPAEDMTTFDPNRIPQGDPECSCGWPYQMLLPKGKTGAGMAFQLAVVITDASVDLMETEDACGSFSFCAARTEGYPDRRPLGYPFNRPFPAK
jgi:hypothetical protein